MKIIKSVTLVLVSSLLMIMPAGAGAAAAGKIVIARGVDVTSLDPQKASSSVDLNYCSAVFDGLLRSTGENELSLNLAESYRNINPTIWEFKIRKGVFFHNGDPLTAADVVFSYNRTRKANNPFKAFFAGFKDVIAVDPYTVHIITVKPDPILPKRVAFAAYIVPEKYIREKGDEYFAQHPVGTGRYKFVKRTVGKSIELEANERYWGEKPATVRTLVFISIADPKKRVEALKRGEVQVVAGVPPYAVADLQKHPELNVISGPSGRVIFIAFNILKPGGSPVSDKRVRQAISYAINKEALIRDTLLGSGKILATPLVPSVFGYDPSIPPYPYDPVKARKLLAEAGYPKGFEIALATPSGRYILDRQVAYTIAGMLSKVGIRTSVKIYEWAAYREAYESHRVEPIYLLGWGNSMYDADGVLVPLFTSGAHNSSYSNPALDRLLEAARFEMDPEKRRAIYRQSLLLIHDDVPGVFLYEQVERYGVSGDVLNFLPPAGSERKDSDMLELKNR
jgi:peptide/nickel transport system substrate-binding protein